MRSSIFPLIYSIFLFKSSFISSTSFSYEEKNQHDMDKVMDELENSYYENEAILALGFSMNFDINSILMNQSVETSITQPPVTHQILEESGVLVTNPSPALKPSGKRGSKNVEIKNAEIRERLFKLFQAQVPRADYDLRNFEIEGWPESVDRLRRRWNLPEIDLIDQNFINFKFIPIPRITYEKQHGFDISGVDFAYDENLSEKDVIEKLRNRYRIESRHTDADRIEWKQLDRSKIPKKYDSVPISGPAMKIAQIRRCPEIVENIHFHPLSDYELFCKSFTRGTKNHYLISKYKKIQVDQGILPDPKYEMEDVNGSIVRTFDGVPVIADQNSSSDEQADESPEPNFTNEEFEELFSKIMMPENDSTIHNIRKRTFDLIEPQNHVNFFMD